MKERTHSERSAALGVVLLVLAASALVSCHRDPSPRIKLKVIERCEDGVQVAIRQKSVVRLERIYHEQCASVFLEPACRDAFYKAGRAPLDRQDRLSLDGCRKAYCPLLAPSSLEACAPDFHSTEESVARAWPPLELAILRYDARGYSFRMEQTLLGLYAVRQKREAEARAESARAALPGVAAGVASADATEPAGGPP